MVTLTPKGEVAEFIDDNQFGSGQSTMKCGPEAVALVWHAVAPGAKNPYSSADVHAMAHADYAKFIGPDNSSDQAGTSNEILYAMLKEHGFQFLSGPATLSFVRSELDKGHLVIIGITEASVEDLELNKLPYSWPPGAMTHIIVASGPGANAGELLVRDTANIGPQGVRPGPRRYNAYKLQLVSATSVTPTWLKPPAPPPPPKDWLKQAQDALSALSEAMTHLHA